MQIYDLCCVSNILQIQDQPHQLLIKTRFSRDILRGFLQDLTERAELAPHSDWSMDCGSHL